MGNEMPKDGFDIQPDPARFEEVLAPFALEVGKISIAWNNLHENFSNLFWYAIGPGAYPAAIWHSVGSDRAQRNLLRAAALGGAFAEAERSEVVADILWALEKADHLSDHRNNAVHGPINAHLNYPSGEYGVAPVSFFGNPRAKRLAEKPDLLEEFRWYAQSIDLINKYVVEIIKRGPFREHVAPVRPTLPKLTAAKKAKRHVGR